MEEGEPNKSGVMSALRRLASTVLKVVQNRLELLTVELQEERIRLVNMLLLTASVAVLGFLTLATAVVTVMIVTWDRFGVTGMLVLTAAGLVATLLTYWWLRTRLKNWSFLPSTLAELKKDRQCLEDKN